MLAQSPVLARMTNSGFSESITKEIILPEDDEDAFGRIIELLYGNFYEAYNFRRYDESTSVQKLADMFVLADKYDLRGLQGGIVNELEDSKLLNENRAEFFSTAYRIAQDSQDSYRYFLQFFVDKAAVHLKSITAQEINTLLEMVYTDGRFAVWMVQAQTRLFREESLKWSRNNAKMNLELHNTKAELDAVKKSLVELQQKQPIFPPHSLFASQNIFDIPGSSSSQQTFFS